MTQHYYKRVNSMQINGEFNWTGSCYFTSWRAYLWSGEWNSCYFVSIKKRQKCYKASEQKQQMQVHTASDAY